MTVLIPVRWFYQGQQERLLKGWTAETCPRCKRVQAFRCEEDWQADHLFFISVADTKLGELVTCNFCDSSFGVPEGVKPKIDPFWEPANGLQALIDKTNPQLGKVEVKKDLSNDELLGLLESIHERTSMYKANVGGWAILGAVIVAPLSAGLGVGLRSLEVVTVGSDNLGQGILFFLCGILIGALVGSIFGARISRRREAVRLFRKATAEKNVDTDRLWSLAATSSHAALIATISTSLRKA